MTLKFIPDDDPSYFYNGYRIFWNADYRLYGIKDPDGKIVIKPIFSSIKWHITHSGAVIVFKLNEKTAFCHFHDMLTLDQE